MGEDVEELSSMLLDVNLDGENDVFDLIGLRKLLLAPENSKVLDLVNSQVRLNSDSIKLENAEDATRYYEEILNDSEEIKKFTELYDEEFFKENVLILRSMVQEKLDGLNFDFSDILTSVTLISFSVLKKSLTAGMNCLTAKNNI